MGSGIALDNAEIMSTVLEAILYGVYVLLIFASFTKQVL